MRQVCALCRHLGEPTTAAAAPGGRDEADRLLPMGGPPGAWCPVWRMGIANPAVTGCTLFEAVPLAGSEDASDGANEV